MIVALLAEDESGPPVDAFGRKYGYNAADAAAAARRMAGTLGALAAQLRRQRDRGVRFLVGDRLSALDIYWTAFSNIIAPLPKAQLPIPDEARPMFTATDTVILDALDPLLLEHRREIFADWFRDPVEM